MASLHITAISNTVVSWSVSGLGNPWNTSFYQRIVLSVDSSQSNNTTVEPYGILDSMYAPSSGSSTSTSSSATTGGGAFSGGNTYYLYAYAQTASGRWFYVDSSWVTMEEGRPSDFEWTTNKNSGYDFNILASEWQTFTSKINLFRKYKRLSDYNFTSAYTGYYFTATHYNEVRNAMVDMYPSTSLPSWRGTGASVLASDINRLRDSLNSIN